MGDLERVEDDLRLYGLLPRGSSALQLAATQLRPLVDLVQAFHPEMDFATAAAWVNRNAVRFTPSPQDTIPPELLNAIQATFEPAARRSRGTELRCYAIDGTIWPLLGPAARIESKLNACRDKPPFSLRTYAERHGMDAASLVEAADRFAECGKTAFADTSLVPEGWGDAFMSVLLQKHAALDDYSVSPLAARLMGLSAHVQADRGLRTADSQVHLAVGDQSQRILGETSDASGKSGGSQKF